MQATGSRTRPHFRSKTLNSLLKTNRYAEPVRPQFANSPERRDVKELRAKFVKHLCISMKINAAKVRRAHDDKCKFPFQRTV